MLLLHLKWKKASSKGGRRKGKSSITIRQTEGKKTHTKKYLNCFHMAPWRISKVEVNCCVFVRHDAVGQVCGFKTIFVEDVTVDLNFHGQHCSSFYWQLISP